MKILFVLENYFPNIGGVETLFKTLVDNIREEGYQITIITNKTNYQLPFKEEKENLTIYRFPFNSRYAFTFLAWLPATYYAFKNDLIHTTSYNAGIPAYIASVFSRRKVIITFHEVWGKLWFRLPFFRRIGMWLHYLFEKFLLILNFDLFIAVSEYTKARLIKSGVSESKVIRIYNGIDYSNQVISKANHENEKFRFLYFGRLGISKGLDILLGAVEILSKRGNEFELMLVIPTVPISLRKIVEDLIEKYKISLYTIIKSELSDQELSEEISQADTIVVPSYSEGFCFSAVESIAKGKPIISSDRGALKEVVCGSFLKMSEHTPENLADCMERALKNDWDKSPIVKFHLEETINNYKDLYRELQSV